MVKALESWTVQPHGPLVEIDDGILSATGDIVMPLGKFPRRMTVVRLASGGTAIFSAMALAEPEMARIEALGKPNFLIVPNPHHRLDAGIFKMRYPNILVLTPAGTRAAAEEVVTVDATDDVLGDPDIRFLTVDGMAAREAALSVKRAGGTTLIVNDLIGHVAHPRGPGAWVMSRMMGFGPKAQVPRAIKRMLIDDKAAVAGQMRAWAELPGLKRIIVSHGDVIEDRPAAVLRGIANTLSS